MLVGASLFPSVFSLIRVDGLLDDSRVRARDWGVEQLFLDFFIVEIGGKRGVLWEERTFHCVDDAQPVSVVAGDRAMHIKQLAEGIDLQDPS